MTVFDANWSAGRVSFLPRAATCSGRTDGRPRRPITPLAEPDLLVVIDVYLDIESMADYSSLQVDAAEMEYDQLFALVEADPELAARRPGVQEGVASGRIQVQYVRMIIDEDWDCQVATYPPASAADEPETPEGPWYPLLARRLGTPPPNHPLGHRGRHRPDHRNAPITSGAYIVENGRARSFFADL